MSLIPSPSISEIRCAFDEAQTIYPTISGLSSRMLLVPHAGVHESRIVTAATLMYLSKTSGDIILLGTNHRNIQLPTPLTFITNNTADHSLEINSSFLSYMNKPYNMALLQSEADPNVVAESLANWLAQNPTNILIVSSDLSHYHNNQEQDNINETPLIQSLIQGNYSQTDNSWKSVNACGYLVLQVVSRIANILKWTGEVTCYSDSRGKRLGWSTINGDTAVSYLGMIWTDNDINVLSAYDQQLLVAYAKSCIISGLLLAPPPILPLWSKWYNFNNGAFVGIKDTHSNGTTRASIGNYQSPNKTIVDNIRNAAFGTIEDAADRWKQPLNIKEIDLYLFYVNILQDKDQWETHRPIDLLGHISSQSNYGFYLVIGNLRATFLPSVWSDMADSWSYSDLMTKLTIKAGGQGSEWRNPNAQVQLYHTSYIELAQYRAC